MYKNSRGYNAIKINENGKQIEILEHRLNALINHSLNEILSNDVHHKNNIRFDNSLNNLKVLSKSQHLKIHSNKTGNGNLIYGDKCRGSKNPAKRNDVRLKMSESSKKHLPTIYKAGKRRGKQTYGIRYNGKRLAGSINLNKLHHYMYAMYFNLKYNYLEVV